MTKIKKSILILTFILSLTSCKENKEVVNNDKKVEIENPSPKPISRSIDIKSTSFASDVLLDYMKEQDNFSYNPNFTYNYDDLIKGNFDIAVVPAILAPSIYNSTNAGVKISAISLINNLYAASDSEINSPKDLYGKTLLMRDMGEEYKKAIDSKLKIFKGILGINIEYYKDLNDLEKILGGDKSYLAIVSDPILTSLSKREGIITYKLSDIMPFLSNESEELETDLISEVILVNNKYLRDNKKTVDKFLDDYKLATKEVKENTNILPSLINKYGLSESEIANIYESLETVYIDGDTMKAMFNIYLDGLDKLRLNIYSDNRPSDDFYYTR